MLKAALVCISFMILIGFLFKTYLDYRERRLEKSDSDSNVPKP